MKLHYHGLAVTVGMMFLSNWSLADDMESKGFIEDSHLQVLSRTMYMTTDAKKGGYFQLGGSAKRAKDTGIAKDFGTSVNAIFTSGYTQGTVGFGIDFMAMYAQKLDGGRGASAGNQNGIFTDHGRSGRPEKNISKLAPVIKARISKTELKYGQMLVNTPVFATYGTDDKLLPQDATGFFLSSKEVDNLTINGGYFTAMRTEANSGHDTLTQNSDFSVNGETLRRIYFVGAEYQFNENFSGQFYASRNKDFWRKYYTNLTYNYNLNQDNSVNVDFNWYNTKSIGKGYADVIRANGSNRRINSNLWSLALAYTYKAHTFTVAYQKNSGTGTLGGISYPYNVEGGNAIAVSNAVIYSDFNFENQASWQVAYNLDFSYYGVPGLTFGIAYVNGDNATNANKNNRKNGKAWERDISIVYTIPEGKAKNLSFTLQHATYRSNFGGSNATSINGNHNAHGRNNVDELRLIASYPIDVF